jgi:hypothetical protein
MRPSSDEYLPYFDRYVSLVTEDDVLGLLNTQAQSVHGALSGLTEERAAYRYASGKWTVREALGHLIDTERIFGYRALSVARGETFSLPSFEQDDYVAAAGHDRAPVDELAEEFATLRRSHVLLFRHLDDEAWRRIGTVNHHPTSARALAYIMAGHVRHHAHVFSERYGIPVRA